MILSNQQIHLYHFHFPFLTPALFVQLTNTKLQTFFFTCKFFFVKSENFLLWLSVGQFVEGFDGNQVGGVFGKMGLGKLPKEAFGICFIRSITDPR